MRRAALALALLAALAGCGGSSSSSDSDLGERPNVFAASSLTEVFPKLDPEANYNFAGSNDLATQIQEGAPADVFAAASAKYPDQLYADGLVDKPEVFATNRLVLIVPTANQAGIESVDDLRRKDAKLVIGAEGVPIGDYTRTVLENMGASDVLDRVVSQEDDVKGVVGKVALGEADAGFVYVTDVKPVEAKVTAIQLPASAQAEVNYEIAVVKSAPHHDAAHAFVERVLGVTGRQALEAAGFGLP